MIETTTTITRSKNLVIMLISNELDTKTTEANKDLSEEEEILMYSMFIDDNNLYKNSYKILVKEFNFSKVKSKSQKKIKRLENEQYIFA